jgi:BioD-like phosphotransacetylase family protein
LTAIYVTSTSEKSGRTMLCAGLAKFWFNSGKKVGYLKLQLPPGKDKPAAVEADAVFMQQLLGLSEPAETLVGTSATLKADYGRLSPGKDIVIVEGLTLSASKSLPEAIDARVLVVHDFSSPLSSGMAEYKKIGKRLIGVILNKVPQGKLAATANQASQELSRDGLKSLGVIPEDRLLSALSVAELAAVVHGKILNNAENSGDLVENYMLGALAYDSGVEYFQRKENKAVILKGDRPDMQLAALQTSLRCIIISGGAPPIPMVAIQAKDKKVPLIQAAGENLVMAAAIEGAVSNAKFGEENKMPLLMETLGKNLDLKALATF